MPLILKRVKMHSPLHKTLLLDDQKHKSVQEMVQDNYFFQQLHIVPSDIKDIKELFFGHFI